MGEKERKLELDNSSFALAPARTQLLLQALAGNHLTLFHCEADLIAVFTVNTMLRAVVDTIMSWCVAVYSFLSGLFCGKAIKFESGRRVSVGTVLGEVGCCISMLHGRCFVAADCILRMLNRVLTASSTRAILV